MDAYDILLIVLPSMVEAENVSDHPCTKNNSLTKLFYISTKIYQPKQGVFMGSPMSTVNAEVFLQHYEDANIKHLLDTKNIAFYTRYVDDILVIYDATKCNLHTITTYINKIHKNIKT
jgi:hypothetical protein